MSDYPQPISLTLKLYESEEHPFTKSRRLIDLAEAVIKYYTVVIVSNYMETKEIHEEVKAILGAGLKTPSLGIWAFFTERIHRHIPMENAIWKDFPEFFQKVLKQATAPIIEMRNSYAHGSIPSPDECLEDCKRIFPHIEKILKTKYLTDYKLIVTRDSVSQNNIVFIISPEGKKVSLHPLLVLKPEIPKLISEESFENILSAKLTKEQKQIFISLYQKSEQRYKLKEQKDSDKLKKLGIIFKETGFTDEKFFYYNDLRSDKAISLLNYDASLKERDKELMEIFSKIFPIQEWGKIESPFKNRIEELTENFIGRKEELSNLKKFIEYNDKGHYMIWGSVGVGKSALVARAVQELSWFTETKKTNLHVVEYFIRRGTLFSKPEFYLETLYKQLEYKFQTKIPLGNTISEKVEKSFERFAKISETLVEKKEKLVVFIDGLDEANEDLLQILPIQLYPQILFIFSSRPVPASKKIYENSLNFEYKKEITLSGLSLNDIRALLFQYINKYELSSEYTEVVLIKSEGNPLYLHLLCNELFNGEIKLNDSNVLPKEIGIFYKSILSRYMELTNGEKILEFLFLLAVSLDYLHADTIALFLEISRPLADKILEECLEVLQENPITTEFEDWQIFHESFREFLKIKYPKETKSMEERILSICRNWESITKENNDLHTIRYVLSYYAKHLSFQNTPATDLELAKIVLNKSYIETQLKHLEFYDTTLSDAVLALGIMTRNHPKELSIICQLALLSGEFGNKAESDIHIAFEWAKKEGRFKDAVRRVSILQDKKELFKALFLLLWIAADREETSAEVNKENCGYLLTVMEDEIPADNSDWSEFASETLAVEVVGKVIRFTDKIHKFLNLGKKEVASAVLNIVLKKHNLMEESNQDLPKEIIAPAETISEVDADETILENILALVQEEVNRYQDTETISFDSNSDMLTRISNKLMLFSQYPELDDEKFSNFVVDIVNASIEIQSNYYHAKIFLTLANIYLRIYNNVFETRDLINIALVRSTYIEEAQLLLSIINTITLYMAQLVKLNDEIDSANKLQPEELEELFDKLINVAIELESGNDKTLIFYDIAIGLYKVGFSEKTNDLISRYNQLENGDNLNEAIVVSLSNLETEKDFRQAFVILNQMENWENSKFFYIRRLAVMLFERNYFDLAETLLENIMDDVFLKIESSDHIYRETEKNVILFLSVWVEKIVKLDPSKVNLFLQFIKKYTTIYFDDQYKNDISYCISLALANLYNSSQWESLLTKTILKFKSFETTHFEEFLLILFTNIVKSKVSVDRKNLFDRLIKYNLNQKIYNLSLVYYVVLHLLELSDLPSSERYYILLIESLDNLKRDEAERFKSLNIITELIARSKKIPNKEALYIKLLSKHHHHRYHNYFAGASSVDDRPYYFLWIKNFSLAVIQLEDISTIEYLFSELIKISTFLGFHDSVANALQNICNALSKNKRISLSIFGQIAKQCAKINVYESKSIVYKSLVSALIEAEYLEFAKNIFYQCIGKGVKKENELYKSVSFQILALILKKSSRIPQGDAVLEKAMLTLNNIQENYSDAIRYALLATLKENNEFQNENNLDKLILILKESSLDAKAKYSMIEEIINQFLINAKNIRKKQLEDLMQIVLETKGNSSIDHYFNFFEELFLGRVTKIFFKILTELKSNPEKLLKQVFKIINKINDHVILKEVSDFVAANICKNDHILKNVEIFEQFILLIKKSDNKYYIILMFAKELFSNKKLYDNIELIHRLISNFYVGQEIKILLNNINLIKLVESGLNFDDIKAFELKKLAIELIRSDLEESSLKSMEFSDYIILRVSLILEISNIFISFGYINHAKEILLNEIITSDNISDGSMIRFLSDFMNQMTVIPFCDELFLKVTDLAKNKETDSFGVGILGSLAVCLSKSEKSFGELILAATDIYEYNFKNYNKQENIQVDSFLDREKKLKESLIGLIKNTFSAILESKNLSDQKKLFEKLFDLANKITGSENIINLFKSEILASNNLQNREDWLEQVIESSKEEQNLDFMKNLRKKLEKTDGLKNRELLLAKFSVISFDLRKTQINTIIQENNTLFSEEKSFSDLLDHKTKKSIAETHFTILSGLQPEEQNYPLTPNQEKQIATETTPLLLEALNWLPTNLETAYLGVRAITVNLARQGEWDTLRVIYKDCPQLGMTDVFSETDNTELPPEAKQELAELECELKEGEITEKGFEKKKEKILEKWKVKV